PNSAMPQRRNISPACIWLVWSVDPPRWFVFSPYWTKVQYLSLSRLSRIILQNCAVNLTDLNFYSDNQLKDRLASTSATSDQLVEALRINSEARTRALKIGFLVLSGLAF